MTGRELRLVILCVIAVILAHVIDVSGWTRPRLGTDVFHVFAFALIGFFVVRSLRARRGLGWWPAALLTLAISLGLGLLGEAAQIATSRDADWGDIGRDLVGTGAGIAVAAVLAVASHRDRLLLTGVAAGLLVGGCLPSITESLAWWSADEHFPVLDSFENRLQRPLWRSTGADFDFQPGADGTELCGEFSRGNYPGVARRVPSDWRGYARLDLDLVASTPTEVVIRIHDLDHDGRHADRFNRTLKLDAGPARVSIPMDAIRTGPRERELALDRVHELILFVPRPPSPTIVCFDNIVLSP